ncbi:hypothetical protein G6O67_005822 [Ophiocordyceps sinensis]|uniref:Uncharacterized protein n=1 Tax=Ophiocordyceps sinensis TaxID=72228 RepID=A0A8H4LXT6_9HYPO|nr:hypothetical protein G6O67_005822 [Ophiocordyceps sinensis]
MHAFCCCSSRRREKPVSGQDDKAASSLPVSSPTGLAESRFDWNVKTQEPPVRADDGSASAQVSPCEGPVERCQLVVDNDSESHDDTSQSAKRSTGTLEVVRSKLIRHMPQDNELRRQSRLAAGHSEEELARRAELRRFRQQRIQDELDKDKSNDQGSETSHRSTRYLSPLIQLGQSGIGPRDTIEFTVDNGIILSDEQKSGHQQDLCESSKRRRSNSAVSEAGPGSSTRSLRHLPRNRAADDSCMASANEPSHPTTARNASLARLVGCSLNAARPDSVLGVDNEFDFDIRRGSHAWDDQSTLGVWLIAQGMRSRDCSFIHLEDTESDRGSDREQTCPPPSDFNGIDRIVDISDEPRRTSLPGSSPWDEGHGNFSPSQCSSQFGDVTKSDPDVLGSDDSKTDTEFSNPRAADHGSGPTVKQPLDNVSSYYPSALQSFQPSPDGSTTNNYSLSPQDIESLELSPDLGNSEGQSSYTTAEEQDASSARRDPTTALSNKHASQVGSVSNSTAHSETKSFQHREAELRTIEQRFGDVISRRQVDIPLHSRFREEFTKPTTQAPAKISLAVFDVSVPRGEPRATAWSESRGTQNPGHFPEDN